MTRHGTVCTSAGGTLPAANSRVPIVIIDADRAAPSYATTQQHRAEAQRSGLSPSIQVLPDGSRAIADTSRKQKSP